MSRTRLVISSLLMGVIAAVIVLLNAPTALRTRWEGWEVRRDRCMERPGMSRVSCNRIYKPTDLVDASLSLHRRYDEVWVLPTTSLAVVAAVTALCVALSVVWGRSGEAS